jgi:hypothetical protein
MTADSDDGCPVGEPIESDIDMLQRVILDNRDPRVHEFSDLSISHEANAEERDDEMLDAPEASPSMMIEKGRVFKDLTALNRWLHHYDVLHKRSYLVLYSYEKRCYREIDGYPPLHHRWCSTRHLTENLLRNDGVKDNYDELRWCEG